MKLNSQFPESQFTMPVGIMKELSPDMVPELPLWQKNHISRLMHHQGDMLLDLLDLMNRRTIMNDVTDDRYFVICAFSRTHYQFPSAPAGRLILLSISV